MVLIFFETLSLLSLEGRWSISLCIMRGTRFDAYSFLLILVIFIFSYDSIALSLFHHFSFSNWLITMVDSYLNFLMIPNFYSQNHFLLSIVVPWDKLFLSLSLQPPFNPSQQTHAHNYSESIVEDVCHQIPQALVGRCIIIGEGDGDGEVDEVSHKLGDQLFRGVEDPNSPRSLWRLSEPFDDQNWEGENSQWNLNYYAWQASHWAALVLRISLLSRVSLQHYKSITQETTIFIWYFNISATSGFSFHFLSPKHQTLFKSIFGQFFNI